MLTEQDKELLREEFEKIRRRKIALDNLKFIHYVSWTVLGVAMFILILVII